ncbi:MAG: porin family protein [Alphaproteobacteria bacterium]|nr:porin family protein [Alphaproteobacteria bacterium]
MKKLLLTASALILGMSLAQNASADCNGLYLAGRGGAVKHFYKDGVANTKKLHYDQKLMLSGALGWRYDYFRTEVEYVWRQKNKKTRHAASGTGLTNNVRFSSESLMLNGYFDLAPFHWLTPYVGAGIGFTKMKFKSTTYSEWTGETTNNFKGKNPNPTRFTWSVGGGLSVKVTNRFNVDAGYRYYDMGKLHAAEITAHEIYGGVRYVF